MNAMGPLGRELLAWVTIATGLGIGIGEVLGPTRASAELYFFPSAAGYPGNPPVGLKALRQDFPWNPERAPWVSTLFAALGTIITGFSLLHQRRRLWPLLLTLGLVTVYLGIPWWTDQRLWARGFGGAAAYRYELRCGALVILSMAAWVTCHMLAPNPVTPTDGDSGLRSS